MPRLTMSSLPRAMRCPASVVLPQIDSDSEDSRRGTEIHDLVEGALVGDLHCIGECSSRGIDLDRINAWLPAGTAEPLLVEPKVAYHVRDREGRSISRPGSRNYGDCSTDEIPGSADLALWDGPTLFLADIKTGFHQDAVAGPVAENWQLRGLALALAFDAGRPTPVAEVRAALIHIREDGSVWIDEVRWGPGELGVWATELEALWERLESPVPRVRTSSHCSWCPAILSCPATVEAAALLRPVRPGEAPAECPDCRMEGGSHYLDCDSPPHVGRLPPEDIAEALLAWRHVKKVGDAIEARARLLTEQGLLPGWKLVRRERRELDGGISHQVLKDMYGPEVAREGVEVTTTRERLASALRAERDRRIAASLNEHASEQEVAAARKNFRGWLSRAEKETRAEIETRGGVEVRHYETLTQDTNEALPAPASEDA